MASFYVIRGKDNGQHFQVRGAVAQIGRGAGSPIQLNDTEVSRHHAMIIRDDEGAHEIVDNSSSNGTYVNSRRVAREYLRSGDRVQVGRTLMIYTGGPEPNDSASTRSHLHTPDGGEPNKAVEIVAESSAAPFGKITTSMESQHAVGASSMIRGVELPFGTLPSESDIGRDGPGTDSSDNEAAASPPENATGSDAISDSQQWTGDDWEVIHLVGQAVRRTLDVDDLLDQVLDLIFKWINCDRGCVMLLDSVTGLPTPTCSRDRSESSDTPQGTDSQHASSGRRIMISRTILDHVLNTKEGVLTSNAQDDSRWESKESIASLGVHEAICVPMLGRYGAVGAIYVDTTVSAGVFAERKGQSSFTPQHLKLMLAVAGQAALAIEDTQFYQAKVQAERLAAMGQTIANLSHHVKNILQGVRGGSYLVDDGIKKEKLDVIGRGWKIVQRNQDRISNLVMDMLSFSKDREPDFELANVSELVSDVVELMADRASDANVNLVWNAMDPIPVEFDSEAMHRAVLNVVTNAIDAAASAAQDDDSIEATVELAVDVSVVKNRVRIKVLDTGEGISVDDQQKIFAPFESSKGARGTGLGLPVSRKILREHGGDISIKSEPGQGTKFTLHWPATQSQIESGTIEST